VGAKIGLFRIAAIRKRGKSCWLLLACYWLLVAGYWLPLLS